MEKSVLNSEVSVSLADLKGRNVIESYAIDSIGCCNKKGSKILIGCLSPRKP